LVSEGERDLTVAVTGPTGTFGFGLLPLPLPAGPAQSAARAMAALPFLPPAVKWVEAASHPAIVDSTRARKELGWTPRFTALEALRDTVRRGL
jgi:nucleoside-diphosphate-sugar epimerase